MNRIITMYHNERNEVEIDFEIDGPVKIHNTYSGIQYARLTVTKGEALKMLAALANVASDNKTGRWLPPYK